MYAYTYIYICVCVCVCVWRAGVPFGLREIRMYQGLRVLQYIGVIFGFRVLGAGLYGPLLS